MSFKGIAYNLFAYPQGYFKEHSAEELGVTEEERKELIKMQKPLTEKEKKEEKKKAEQKQKDFENLFKKKP